MTTIINRGRRPGPTPSSSGRISFFRWSRHLISSREPGTVPDVCQPPLSRVVQTSLRATYWSVKHHQATWTAPTENKRSRGVQGGGQ